MSVEYLLVVYKQDRDVLADGDRVGVTNHTILLAPDEYIITLSGDGYAPSSEDVVLGGTSIMRPKIIVFTRAEILHAPRDRAVAARPAGARPGSLRDGP